MQQRVVAKAMNDKVTEEAIKIEEINAQKNETHFPNGESKIKQARYCGKLMHERPRWSVEIAAKAQVESVERLL